MDLRKVRYDDRDWINLAQNSDQWWAYNNVSSGTWELREVSLIHQKVLVIAEIAWEPRVTRGVYLVTWEVDGGGLKGNLFTDSTCVTLSLWPDTIYHIQTMSLAKRYMKKSGVWGPSQDIAASHTEFHLRPPASTGVAQSVKALACRSEVALGRGFDPCLG
ncbi:hypothetical protein ANN_00568 [Periplaneta americana]|uniref:Uncharacterized protein n=1 Tax=Periplaneta americana TaxID=6978 RepID=A0ABQ8TR93_PERAM|nr:hypothetical protein ANN_00568 [Periplaneta americana]